MDQDFEYLPTVKDPTAFIQASLTRSASRLRTIILAKTQKKQPKKSIFANKATSLTKYQSTSYFTTTQPRRFTGFNNILQCSDSESPDTTRESLPQFH